MPDGSNGQIKRILLISNTVVGLSARITPLLLQALLPLKGCRKRHLCNA
jgi:hypothetical protein